MSTAASTSLRPVIQTNVTGTSLSLRLRAGLPYLVLFTFPPMKSTAISRRASRPEDDSLQPSSPYSASKAASDLLVRSYVRTYKFPALLTRSSNNYGPYQFPEKFLPLMITNALQGEPLPIYGDGKQQRDWLHVEDNCRGILAVLERGRIGEVYNLGGSHVEENLSLARRLLRLVDKPEDVAPLCCRPSRPRSPVRPWIPQKSRPNLPGSPNLSATRSPPDDRMV